MNSIIKRFKRILIASVLGAMAFISLPTSNASDYVASGAYYKWSIDASFTGSNFLSSKCLNCSLKIEADFDDGLGWRQVWLGWTASVYETVGLKTINVKTTLSGQTALAKHTLSVTKLDSLNSPFPLDRWSITADIPYGGEYATGEVYIYNSTWKRGAPIDKPIVLVDGFDPGNENREEGLFAATNQQNLMADLRRMGYDIFILNPNDGAGAIQKNAFLLVKLINTLNSITINKEPLVIIGPSMGGLIARYALAYMEKNGQFHNTRLYVSLDSPHQGANIPLGIQHFLNFFQKVGEARFPVAEANLAKINSPAARQMLVYHHSQPSSRDNGYPLLDFDQFYTELKSLGYPKKLRKIALTNGSASGKGQASLAEGAELIKWDYRDNKNCFDIKAPEPYVIYSHVLTISPGAKIFGGQVKACWFVFPVVKISVKEDGKNAASHVKPYDNAPGGHFDAPKTIDATLTPYGDIVASSPVATFVPTISALDIATDNLFYNIRADAQIMSKTPFDAIYYPVATDANEPHVAITNEKKQVLMREIIGYGWLVPIISNLLL